MDPLLLQEVTTLGYAAGTVLSLGSYIPQRRAALAHPTDVVPKTWIWWSATAWVTAAAGCRAMATWPWAATSALTAILCASIATPALTRRRRRLLKVMSAVGVLALCGVFVLVPAVQHVVWPTLLVAAAIASLLSYGPLIHAVWSRPAARRGLSRRAWWIWSGESLVETAYACLVAHSLEWTAYALVHSLACLATVLPTLSGCVGRRKWHNDSDPTQREPS